MPSPKITIIGVGGLGKALAKAMSAADISIKSIFNRTADKAEQLAGRLNVDVSGDFPSDVSALGDLIFITVSDSAIKAVAQKLADFTDDFHTKTIVHCSGNEPAALLDNLKTKGGSTASFHPLQTFTVQSSPSAFKDIYFSLQGDKAAYPKLKQLAHNLGAETLVVNEDQKSHLHAAAVIGSNYLHALLQAAVDTASISGLSPKKAKKALIPLMRQTLQNVDTQSFGDALTGPIKRGDIQTVEKHLHLLKDQPELLDLYQMLGQRTVKIAQKSGAIDGGTTQKLIKILN